ncbi:hypothetical protein B5807_12113 [Epicoccum nigrum]|uniref:Uncharacterized protein n=1 Tax=Epicoccum nigrum TaxID=105696 RepID=A0A1Y2LK44_EPING|nr:hypothetical protein B5807_12113 [Epicoccum nigrum]
MELELTTRSRRELELERESDFRSRLRSLCGLFVSVYHGKVYFLHQTAREFLRADASTSAKIPQNARWQQSITLQYAHKVLAELCVRVFSFFESKAELTTGIPVQNCDPSVDAFFNYAAVWWPMHFREASLSTIEDHVAIQLGLEASDPRSRCFGSWVSIYSTFSYTIIKRDNSHLTVASLVGNDVLVQTLLDKGADVNAQGGEYGNALQAASYKGHGQVVKMLLDEGAGANAQCGEYGTALYAALVRGYEQVVEMLLDNGVDVNEQSTYYGSALHAASALGYEKVVQMLLDKGADPLMTNASGWAPFDLAAENRQVTVLTILLKSKAYDEVDNKDSLYGSVMNTLAFKGYTDLLRSTAKHKNANLSSVDSHGRTLLLLAARSGNVQTIKSLLDQGLSTTSDAKGDGLLSYAASSGSPEALSTVLECGLDLSLQLRYWSPLHWACRAGNAEIVETLIAIGLESESVCVAEVQGEWTPLAVAIFHGNKNMLASLSVSAQAVLGVRNIRSICTIQSHGRASCNSCFYVSGMSSKPNVGLINLKASLDLASSAAPVVTLTTASCASLY